MITHKIKYYDKIKWYFIFKKKKGRSETYKLLL